MDWSRELAELPTLLSAHVRISALGAGLAVLIGVPMAVLVARRPRWRAALLGVVGVVQTIPGLALLALMVPLLGAFGFWPALVALVLYALLPIVRNTVTGIGGVDAAVLEAADAMGMTPRQRLLGVELPLALPTIVAGIRTAVVWTVGMATLGTARALSRGASQAPPSTTSRPPSASPTPPRCRRSRLASSHASSASSTIASSAAATQPTSTAAALRVCRPPKI